VRTAAVGDVDWKEFLRIVRLHRIAGLVQDALLCAGIHVPEPQAALLASMAGRIAARSLTQAAESLRLQNAFRRADIAAHFLKGTALECLAYGKLGLKHAWDIDVVVQPADVAAASELLHGCGFKRVRPPPDFSEKQFRSWLATYKECVFWRPEQNIFLELHWRLADNPHCVHGIGASSRSQEVSVAKSGTLHTLADEELFSYLCVHGAQHGWPRLKWLAELGAFLAPRSQEIERLYRASQLHGAGRCAGQALLLCELFFDLQLPAGFSAELRSDGKTRKLCAAALDALVGDEGVWIFDRPFGDFRIRLSRFYFQDGWRYFFSELSSQLVGGTDMLQIPLPAFLHFLYPIIRIPSWLWRVLLRRGKGPLPTPVRPA